MITQIRVGILDMDEATQFYAAVRSGFNKFYLDSQSSQSAIAPTPSCSPIAHRPITSSFLTALPST